MALTQKLRQQIGGALNGPGHKLGKETDKSGERKQIARGLDVATINIYAITQRLECIETDTHRQHNVERDKSRFNTHRCEQLRHTAGKEIIIFESAQYTQIDGYIDATHPLLFDAIAVKSVDKQTANITTNCCKSD